MFVVGKQNSERKENARNDFIAKYQDQLNGTLSGFDRLVFSGTLWKDRLTGMKGYLWLMVLPLRISVSLPSRSANG